jgi:hypothetical protein
MFEKFMSENAADFRQRYEGTYGFYRGEDGKKLLAKLVSIRDTVSFLDSRGMAYSLRPNETDNIGFEFLPPKSGYHNTPKGTLLVTRVPARQFQRGISGKNVTITLLSEVGLSAVRVDFPMLEAIFLTPLGKEEAFKTFKDGGMACSISKQLALLKTKGENYVFLYENSIGNFKFDAARNHFSFKLTEPNLWRTEIVDALKGLGCTAEVA